MKTNVSVVSSLVFAGLAASTLVCAGEPQTPFKLGTFQLQGREFVGLVMPDSRVLDLTEANRGFERRNASAARLRMPVDMKELIARYEGDLGSRLRELAKANAASVPAAYSHALAALRVLPPTRPAVILNAGANYPEHLQGIMDQSSRAAAQAGQAPGPAVARTPSGSAPGIWERPPGDARPDNPYLFLKSPSVVVGANDDVVVPKGREQIDWECEFALVIGKPARNVSVADAPSHVFGYSIEFDVSDRGGRNDRKMGGGPDWLIQKNHDTFAPLGPFIVPKEFVPQPMNTRHYFTLNGEIKQDSNTSRMEYNVWEMLSYASNILSLHPGDFISAGSPPGTNIERQNPRWMKAGDVGVCVVEGIGEQRHNIVARP